MTDDERECLRRLVTAVGGVLGMIREAGVDGPLLSEQRRDATRLRLQMLDDALQAARARWPDRPDHPDQPTTEDAT